MKLENKTDNSCPYCRAEAKTGMIANSFWICGNATTHENRRSELCREREAHNNTKRERDEAREQIARLRAIISQSNRDYDEQIELFRAANAKLRDIAERAIEMKEQEVWGTGELPFSWKQLRAELDQLKEGAK